MNHLILFLSFLTVILGSIYSRVGLAQILRNSPLRVSSDGPSFIVRSALSAWSWHGSALCASLVAFHVYVPGSCPEQCALLQTARPVISLPRRGNWALGAALCATGSKFPRGVAFGPSVGNPVCTLCAAYSRGLCRACTWASSLGSSFIT